MGAPRDVGERIMLLRRRAGMKQEELAQQAGLTRKQISGYETGNLAVIPAEALASIAQVLGTSADALLGLTNAQCQWH